MTRVAAIAGISGFLGRNISEALTSQGWIVRPLPRALFEPLDPPKLRVRDDIGAQTSSLSAATIAPMIDSIRGSDIVINAAGAARPLESNIETLMFANVMLPMILIRAAAEGEVPRLVHVSSAAVQGDQPRLDESASTSALTPYARSKALAEELLLDPMRPWSQVDTLIYRPTSVHGADRPATERLKQALSSRLLPKVGNGESPVPLTSAQSVGRAIAHIAQSAGLRDGIVLHPWEGITQALLLESAPSRIRFRLPASVACSLLHLATRSRVAKLAATARRAQVLLVGQECAAQRLLDDGFALSSLDTIIEEALGSRC